MALRRVVVTGMGALTSMGQSVAAFWENLTHGRSGISSLEGLVDFDLSQYTTRIGGRIDAATFNPKSFMPAKVVRHIDHFVQYGLAAAHEAITDAGFTVDEANAYRIGVSIGSGIGGVEGIEQATLLCHEGGGPRRLSPFFVPSVIINMISGYCSILFGLKGPNLATVTACSTGAHSIGLSARLIAYGDADIMVAGGAEMGITSTGLAGFCAARALSVRNDAPEQASRPFDRDRDGFVMADGAAVVVLEELEHARKRGAPIYAELIGFGMTGDAFHAVMPREDGAGAAQCMRHAMMDAKLNAQDVDYINAHSTGTAAGDIAEVEAIHRALGAAGATVPVSATKSMTGHLLGATGSLEAVISILALRHQIIPPTINLDHPDPDCTLNHVSGTSREATLRTVMSNSFGFGGTNATLIFRAIA